MSLMLNTVDLVTPNNIDTRIKSVKETVGQKFNSSCITPNVHPQWHPNTIETSLMRSVILEIRQNETIWVGRSIVCITEEARQLPLPLKPLFKKVRGALRRGAKGPEARGASLETKACASRTRGSLQINTKKIIWKIYYAQITYILASL